MKSINKFLIRTFGLRSLTEEVLGEFVKWVVKILFVGAFGSFYHNSNAQATPAKQPVTYEFEGSVGIRSFQLVSDVQSLNAMQVQMHGGGIGFRSNTEFLQLKIKPIGFYNAGAGNTLIESTGDLVFFPINYFLSAKPRRFNIYLMGGANLSKLKMNGNYATNPTAQTCIYQTFTANIFYWGLSGGAGAETRVRIGDATFKIFGEYKMALPVSFTSRQETFRNTYSKNLSMINVGVAVSLR